MGTFAFEMPTALEQSSLLEVVCGFVLGFAPSMPSIPINQESAAIA